MSATGTWVVPQRAFEQSLNELRDWRQALANELTAFRRWAIVSRLIDEHTTARLAHIERRLAVERLTVAFIAEFSRGKSELINALFFSDMGIRLLPSGAGRTTLCPAEILWDAARPPSIRLLPIESRAQPEALRELLANPDGWREIALDPANHEGLPNAFHVLSETIVVSNEEAANLGFAADLPERVEIPRWRYAIINFPHPLLASGLTVLDTPGHAALAAEPELTLRRIPDAAAVVFMVAADTGVTAADDALWKEHIATIAGVQETCLVALNKIDMLRDGSKPESKVLEAIDAQVRATADALGVMPTRVFALSALQGLNAKTKNDRDGLIRSRLYRLEQALAKGMVHQRRVDHAAMVSAEARAIFNEARALIESRLGFAREQYHELTLLQGKNQKLVETLARKATTERARIEKARVEMVGFRGVSNRLADEVGKLLDPNTAREIGLQTRNALLNTKFSGGIGGTLDGYFAQVRGRLEGGIKVIAEVQAMMGEARRKFSSDYGMLVEVGPVFATERFLLELDRLQEYCERDFKSATSLLTRGRATLGELFFDTVAIKVIYIFEIADREVRAWMGSFIRPLDAQLTAFQEQTNARIEGMGRIQNAETDLVVRLGELQALMKDVEGQRAQCDAHQEKLRQLLTIEHHSLA